MCILFIFFSNIFIFLSNFLLELLDLQLDLVRMKLDLLLDLVRMKLDLLLDLVRMKIFINFRDLDIMFLKIFLRHFTGFNGAKNIHISSFFIFGCGDIYFAFVANNMTAFV